MPNTPYQDPKASGAKARANASGTDSHMSEDVFDNPSIALLVNTATVEDRQGIERIVQPAVADFTPAPMEPDADAVKRGKELVKTLEGAKKDRLALISGDMPKETRATNNPGDGGSQSTTA